MSQSQQLTIEQAISRAEKAAKQGNAAVARQLYNSVLQHKPSHPIATQGLSELQKELPHNPSVQAQMANPSQDQLNALINLYHSGQMLKTEQACKELLQSYPQSLIVLNLLGAILPRQGQLQQAVQVFNQIIRLQPDDAEVYSNRGVVLTELGRLEEAVHSHDRAIQLKPSFAEAYCNRGIALTKLGQLEEAVANYDKAIELKPDFAGAYCSRGNVLIGLRQLEEAVASYNRVIQLKPDFAEAYYNRSDALMDLGQLEEAVASYDKAIELKPDYAEAYCNRGNVLIELRQLEEAVASYDKAIELKPDFAEAYYNRGNALTELGQLEAAVASYDKTIELQPDFAEAYYNCGNALTELGQLEAAVESYDKAIELQPDCAEAYYNLSLLKKFKPEDPQIGAMESLYMDSEASEQDHIHLCFALAKAYDDLDDYDKCFACLDEGNRRRQKELNYNIETDRRMVAKVKSIFSSGSLTPDVVLDGKVSVQPVFIVGMLRSGTSLAEQILASHSLVHGAGELNAMSELVSSILSKPSVQNTSHNKSPLSQNGISTVHDGYLEVLASLKVSEKIITDKMPLNFKWIGFILSAFPDAKIIHLNRDPRATCWSIYKHYFSSNGNGYAYDLLDLVEFYQLYIDLISAWRELFPNSIYDLCYESLTENQQEETYKMLAFCDLEWEDQCLDFHKTERVVQTASVAQVRQKMYQGSSEEWRKYEKHLQPLIQAFGK